MERAQIRDCEPSVKTLRKRSLQGKTYDLEVTICDLKVGIDCGRDVWKGPK